MKLHLPILLRRAVLAVMAVLATSPAMADNTRVYTDTTYTLTGTDQVLNSNYDAVEGKTKPGYYERTGRYGNYTYYHHSHLEMNGTNFNKIVSKDLSFLGATVPGYIMGTTDPKVKVYGNITMFTTKGYNAIVGSVTGIGGGRPNVTAGNNVVMNGPANAVMLGSTINGTNITLNNTENQTTTIGKVLDGILGDFGATRIPANMKGIEGIFNIVQGSKLNAKESVTLSTATNTAVNQLKANVITGGQGDLEEVVKKYLTDKVGEDIAKTLAGTIGDKIKDNDSGSSITAGTDINLLGGASVIVDTTLSDLLSFGTSKDLAALLAGNENNSTTVTLNAGKNLNLDSIINMAYGAQGGVTLKAGTAKDVVGAINATGAFNIIGGKTTLEADAINLKPTKAVSVNQLIGELDQLGSLLPIDKDTLTGITKNLGDLANQPISASVIAGGANLTATGTGEDGDITIGGTLGLVMNTPVDKVVGSLMSLDPDGEEPVMTQLGNIAKDLLKAGKATSLTSKNGNINVGSQFNLVLGGGADATEGVSLTANAGAVKMTGALNVVGGNTTIKAKDINLVPTQATTINALANGLKSFIDISSITDGALKGLANQEISANIVAGGSQLTALQNITMGGTLGLVMNTPMADVMTELVSYLGHKQETWMVYQLLQKGTATSLTSETGNINVGSQFNLVHGGGFPTTTEAENTNVLTLTANKGDINVQGTANVVSGNVVLNAGSRDAEGNITHAGNITMTGEVLSDGMAEAANGLVDGMNIPGVDKLTSTGILDKLVTKGSVNMVTGGATLTATAEKNAEGEMVGGNITMTGESVDDVGKIGNINAVIDTEITDVVEEVMGWNTGSLEQGGNHMTTLKADGNIDMLGRVNVVNGKYVTLDAGKDVNMQGNISMIGGATVEADGNININTSPEETYKMYMDAEELGALLPKDSPYTKLLTQMGVIDKLGHTGINGAVVAGGANLTAEGNITTGGTASILVNTPMAEVGDRLMSLLTDPEHDDEIWMVKELLGKGIATTLTSTNGNIELGSRLNVLYGGGFTTVEGENALSLNAANGTVKLDGTINMVSGNVQVNANNIELEGNKNVSLNLTPLVGAVMGNSEYADLVTGSGMLDKVADKGINANVVMGGATLKATALKTETGEKVGGNIELSGMANFVLDTQLENVVDAIIETNPQYVVDGGNKLTYLKADGNIDLTGRLNVVNGAYVKLEAGKDVNINGTLNMVSGKAKVNGNNINLVGQDNLGLNWGEIIPGDVGNYMDQMGVTDKLNKGVNGNLVLGGSELTATNDIKLSGMASVVTNVPLGSAYEALNKKMDETWQPELGLMKEMLNDGIATKLEATNGNIEMTSRLNMLHGGNFSADGANALSLTAGKEVNIAGTANIISGNTQVTAGEGIKITGKNSVGFDWNKIAEALPEKYAGYGKLAGEMGILDKLSKGVNGSVIAGGATLTAESGDITMEGMATAVVDVTAENVLTAVETMNGTPIMEGGAEDTTITAVNGSINLNSRLNLVNGGQVTVDAGKNVNMGGTFNVVSGNATVNAGTNIEMNAQNKVGVDITPMLKGHYAEIAKEMGMADVLENGVSSNIVAGGANLQAEGDVVMSGVATAIVDTTASNVIGAVKGNDLGELMKGGRDKTQVIAKNGNIVLGSQMNVVNGGNTKNAGGVLLQAEKGDVVVGGQISVVNRATVKAGNEVAFNGDKSVVKYSDINAKTVSFTGKNAEITDVNFNTASVEVIGTALVNTADSEVAINDLIISTGNIENLGSLELKDAALAGATLHNAGSIEVNGAMTLNSATLSFVADSNNSTLNSTAITLGAEGSIAAGISTFSENGSTDMIAGVSFLLHYDGIEFLENTNKFNYNLAIFQGATEDEYKMLKAAIEQKELTLTLDNGYNVERINSMDVTQVGDVVYISGTATVPEPTTATLSLLALAALAARRRRQK